MGDLPLVVYLTKMSKNYNGSVHGKLDEYKFVVHLFELLKDPSKIDQNLIKKAKYKSKGKMYE